MKPSVTEAKTLVGRVFDYLWGLTRENTMGPGLALDYSISGDGLVWTFYLRHGVKLHPPYQDYEITSEDVKFTIERNMSEESGTSGRFSLRRYVDHVEAPTPYKVVVYTKQPSPLLLNLFSERESQEGIIVPKGLIEQMGADKFFEHPIGSGPWKFVEQEIGSYIKYEANEDYWDKSRIPRFKYLKLMIVPEEATRVAMLRKGEVDIIEISADSKKEVLDAGLDVVSAEGVQPLSVLLFGTYMDPTFPTYHKEVRQALQLAINSEEMLQYIFGGEGTIANVFPWTKRHFAYDPDLKPWPYDPDRARQLLAQAGYAGGFDIKLYMFTVTGVPQVPRMAEAIAGYWDKIGVKASIIPIEYSALRKMYYAKSPKLMGQASTWRSPGMAYGIVGGLRTYYHSVSPVRLMSDPELNQLIDAASQQIDDEEREATTRQIMARLYDECVTLAIINASNLWASNPDTVKWDIGGGHHLLMSHMEYAEHPK